MHSHHEVSQANAAMQSLVAGGESEIEGVIGRFTQVRLFFSVAVLLNIIWQVMQERQLIMIRMHSSTFWSQHLSRRNHTRRVADSQVKRVDQSIAPQIHCHQMEMYRTQRLLTGFPMTVFRSQMKQCLLPLSPLICLIGGRHGPSQCNGPVRAGRRSWFTELRNKLDYSPEIL